MKSIDRGSRCSKAGTFDVDVALRRSTIYVDVQHSSVLIALLYDVILQFRLPVWTIRSKEMETHDVQYNIGLHCIKLHTTLVSPAC